MGGQKASLADVAVGRYIRLYRLKAKLSQTELGDQIGVTFQQVQKYEKGVNRVGAGRLTRIAAVLNVPIMVFFEGAAADSKNFSKAGSVTEHLAAPRAFKLLEAFSGIPEPAVQPAILKLVESIRTSRSGKQK